MKIKRYIPFLRNLTKCIVCVLICDLMVLSTLMVKSERYLSYSTLGCHGIQIELQYKNNHPCEELHKADMFNWFDITSFAGRAAGRAYAF